MKQAEIYFDKEVLVIDFTGKRMSKICDILHFDKVGKEVTVRFIRKNWAHIENHPMFGYRFGINPFDPEYINKVFYQYLEYGQKPVKYHWFTGNAIRFESAIRIKDGWVEFQPFPPKTITTTQYRIIQ